MQSRWEDKTMKSTVKRTTATIVSIVMIAVAVMTGVGTTAMAAERAIGTIEKVEAFRAEAIAEKAIATNNKNIATAEPVVEGATGAAVAEAQETVEETVEVVEATVEETEEVVEVVEETVEFAEGSTASEEVMEDELEVEAVIANTANGENNEDQVQVIESVAAITSADGASAAIDEIEATYTVADVNATYLGTAGGTAKEFVVIGESTLRSGLQAMIDAGNIVCYPSCDMTTGVKYFAGHNPGAMSHMNTIQVGSIVELGNGQMTQQYKVMERQQGAGSFASIRFNTTGYDLWTMLMRGTQNAVVIQFCVNGVNTFWYCEAI